MLLIGMNSDILYKKRFLLLVRDKELFESCLQKIGANGISCRDEKEFIQNLYNEIPECIVIDLESCSSEIFKRTLKSIKKMGFLLEVPILILCSKERLNSLDFTQLQVDDFLVYPLDEMVCIKTLEIIRARSKRTLDANPLTKLPGNTSIITRIQELIEEKKDFALGYVDLNNFKAYNDKYGFARGDDVIRMVARILVNLVNQIPKNTFVGHIGGDDFVFIVPPEDAKALAERIISFFDEIIPSFYDEEDLQAKRIVSTDRQGNIKEFPIMTIGIAIVLNTDRYRFSHYGEIAKVAAELKAFVKKQRDISSYIIDRRNAPER